MAWLTNLLSRLTGFWAPVVVIGYAMFTDTFLYEMVVPLTEVSKAGVTDPDKVAWMYGAYGVSVLVMTPLWGWVTDRIGRKTPLLIGVGAQVIATLLFAFATNFPMMLAARTVQGVASAATWTVGLALIAESYPKRRVAKMGLTMAGMTIGSVFGPLAGGFLHDWGGYYAPYYVAGVLVSIDCALRYFLLSDKVRPPAPSGALRVLLTNRAVLVAALVTLMIAWGWGVLEPFYPPHLKAEFDASPTTVGLLFSVSSLAYALVTGLVDKLAESKSLWITIAAGLVMMGVGLPLLLVAPNLFLAAAALSLVSVAFAFAMNPTLTALADAVDRVAPGAYASVYVVMNIAYSIGMTGGDLVTGEIVAHVSLMAGFAVLTLLMFATIPLVKWGLGGNGMAEEPAKGAA